MKKENLNSQIKKAGVGLLAGVLVPSAAFACACGCGVFDVATSSMFPTGAGGMAFLNYDYQNQNRNWNGTSSAPADNNDDKKIETHFVTLGLQYMFTRSWGAQVEVPYWSRSFTGANDATPPPTVSRNWNGLGDIRLKAIYTGFSEDLSSGLTLGLKLPTGSDNRDSDVVDRDTQISSGSTDVLVGGFFRHQLTHDNSFSWFTQAELDVPVLKQGDYRPGLEADAAAGVYYNNLSLGRVHITPVAQVIGSWRGRDNGAAADADNTGYQRILLSPGIEFHLHPVKIYADAEFPVYQNFTGNQLAASAMFKVSVSYKF